jgi:hypothetical protein
MATGLLKAAVAITLVTCAVVIVVSPFGDLPLTVQNTKAHISLDMTPVSVLPDAQLGNPIPYAASEPLPLTIESDKLDILVTYRC